MRKIPSLATIGLTALVAGCAEKAVQPPPPPMAVAATPTPSPLQQVAAQQKSAPGEATVVTRKATVERIDHKNRIVTLRGEEGNALTFRVDRRVKKLSKVKQGDEVIVAYYEAVAVKVVKPGEATPGITTAEEIKTSKPGQKPGGVGARVTTITATITALDKAKQTVTVQGPQGNSVTVKVQDPARFASLATGDLVELTFTEALAISVTKPAKE